MKWEVVLSFLSVFLVCVKEAAHLTEGEMTVPIPDFTLLDSKLVLRTNCTPEVTSLTGVLI